MRKFIMLLAVVSVSFAFTAQRKNKVIFLGDSITEAGVKPGGYITRIEELSKADGKSDLYDFEGAGISGNKVYDLYLRLEEDVINKKPDIVVIYVGVNDVWHKRSSGTGTDPDKFVKFYQAIINKLAQKGTKMILCTPAVIGEKYDNSNEQDGDLNKYSNLIRDLAKRNNLAPADLREIFLTYERQNNKDNLEKGILTTDRVHLNEKGNQLVAEKLWETIRKLK